jgi:hypothetical protein
VFNVFLKWHLEIDVKLDCLVGKLTTKLDPANYQDIDNHRDSRKGYGNYALL